VTLTTPFGLWLIEKVRNVLILACVNLWREKCFAEKSNIKKMEVFSKMHWGF
jgi:hypothetical protein